MEKKHNISAIINIISYFLIVAIFIYFRIENPFRALTGIYSPFEGLIDAYKKILDLDIAGAFSSYFFFWLIPLYLVIMLFENKLNKTIVKLIKFIVFVCIGGYYLLKIVPHDYDLLLNSYLSSPLNQVLTILSEAFDKIIKTI